MPVEPQQVKNTESTEKKSQEDRIRDLEAALTASRAAAPLNPIPEHGAGKGSQVAETWSLYEQEQARVKL
jgi:hypothetical protein